MKYGIKSVVEYNKRAHVNYIFFWGNKPRKDGVISKSCLSQWWLSDFELDGVRYCCCEQYMMAGKAKLFNDYISLNKILSTNDSRLIKDLGRKVARFNEEKWNENKFRIVLQGNLSKFGQNIALKEFLINTGKNILVEASPHDKVWGIGMSEKSFGIYNPSNWQGENLLGFALMEVRDIIREQ